MLLSYTTNLKDVFVSPQAVMYYEKANDIYCQAVNFIQKIAEGITPSSEILKWVYEIACPSSKDLITNEYQKEICYFSLEQLQKMLEPPLCVFRYSSLSNQTSIYSDISGLIGINEYELLKEDYNCISYLFNKANEDKAKYIVPIVFELLNEYFPKWNGKMKGFFDFFGDKVEEVWKYGKEPKLQMNSILKSYLWTDSDFHFLHSKISVMNSLLGKKRKAEQEYKLEGLKKKYTINRNQMIIPFKNDK